MTLAVAIMMRDEEVSVCNTIRSIGKYAYKVFIEDTGSKDRSIEFAKGMCNELLLDMELIEEKWVDFSTNRNKLLDLAYSKRNEWDFLLLLDCNDVLLDSDNFFTQIKRIQEVPEFKKYTSFSMMQKWNIGKGEADFQGTRLLQNTCKLKYRGVVHEYLCREDGSVEEPLKVPNGVIYQDRRIHSTSTIQRMDRDIQLLLKEVAEKNFHRDVYYLAKTYQDLGNYAEAEKWYLHRHKMGDVANFKEEMLDILIKLGDCCYIQKKPDQALEWYKKSLKLQERPEAYNRITEIYLNYALKCAKLGCGLKQTETVLAVLKDEWDKVRWNRLKACKRAIDTLNEENN